MSKKSGAIIFIIIAILVILGIVFAINNNGPVAPTGEIIPPSGSPSATSTPNTPGTTTATTTGATSYTLAQVAMHATPADCWTAISGSVYNLTSFVTGHPGGQGITKVCGIDGTAIFNAQHGGGAPQAAMLAKLKIGVLAN